MSISRRHALALLAGVCATPALAEVDPLAGRFGGPFALTTGDGQIVRNSDFAGKFMLVYFGYTHCPDICPEDLVIIAQCLTLLGTAGDKVQPLFITVDPARDTPAVMSDYVASISPRFIGLSGSETDIAAVAKAYRVHRAKYLPPAASKDPGNYIVDHSSLKYLMGPDGQFRTLVPHNVSADRMAEILRPYLLRE